MKLKMWIHTVLQIGCVALLLWQGHRISTSAKTRGRTAREEETRQILQNNTISTINTAEDRIMTKPVQPMTIGHGASLPNYAKITDPQPHPSSRPARHGPG